MSTKILKLSKLVSLFQNHFCFFPFLLVVVNYLKKRALIFDTIVPLQIIFALLNIFYMCVCMSKFSVYYFLQVKNILNGRFLWHGILDIVPVPSTLPHHPTFHKHTIVHPPFPYSLTSEVLLAPASVFQTRKFTPTTPPLPFECRWSPAWWSWCRSSQLHLSDITWVLRLPPSHPTHSPVSFTSILPQGKQPRR